MLSLLTPTSIHERITAEDFREHEITGKLKLLVYMGMIVKRTLDLLQFGFQV